MTHVLAAVRRIHSLYDKLIVSPKTRNRATYDKLIDDPDYLQRYWERWKLEGLTDVNYKDYVSQFTRLYKYTKRTKYRDFQYRLLLDKIVVNADLYKWKKRESDLCTFCNAHSEAIIHLLYDCVKVKSLINCVYFELGKSSTEQLCELNTVNFIFSQIHNKTDHVLNFICTFLKQYIYKCRCLGKSISSVNFLSELEYFHEVEYTIAEQENKINRHKNWWCPVVEYE